MLLCTCVDTQMDPNSEKNNKVPYLISIFLSIAISYDTRTPF